MVPPGQALSNRKQVIEVAAPASRVLTRPVSLGAGCIKHLLDAPTKSRSRLWFSRPDRFENREYVVDGKLIDCKRA
jgi:hypothetical protein